MLKPSRYNVLVEDSDGFFLAANILSGAMFRVNRATRDWLAGLFAMRVIDENEKTVAALTENGFFVQASSDELALLGKLHNEARMGREALGVGIAPTLNCNFRCVYCYQKHVDCDMPEEVQAGIVRYVERNIPGRKVLYVNWFGGEPLMKLKTIEKLGGDMMDVCQKTGCDYHAAITTNGYLLTPPVAGILRKNGVREVQVTLDGPPEMHDARRYIRPGDGTFGTIAANIGASARTFDEFIVRINIDRSNAGAISRLLELLEPVRDSVLLAFRPATSSETPERPQACSLPTTEYLSLESGLVGTARQKGFGILNGCAVPGTSFCSAYQRNAIMVDPYGDVHLCPVCVGKRSQRYGVLSGNGTIELVGGPQSDWAAYSPLDDDDCSKCVALPVCMGGCLWYLNARGDKSARCYLKHNLVERIRIDHTINKFVGPDNRAP